MRVESRPRSRGRTPNGPLPTGVTLAAAGERVAGRQRVGLLDRGGGQGLDVQRNLRDLALGARRRDADRAGKRPSSSDTGRSTV